MPVMLQMCGTVLVSVSKNTLFLILGDKDSPFAHLSEPNGAAAITVS